MSGETSDRFFSLPLNRRAALKGAAAVSAGALMFHGHSAVLRAAQATPGGKIVVGKPYEATGTNPQTEQNQTSWEILAVTYESLLAMDDTLQPTPLLAESWTNPDPTTYVF